MNDYNQYITCINKIFDYISKMKVAWPDQDNLNYIGNIEEYKQIVIQCLNLFKNDQNGKADVQHDR